MQLLDDLKETRRYWKLKEEAQDRTLGELSLEEAIDLSRDKYLIDLSALYVYIAIICSYTISGFLHKVNKILTLRQHKKTINK
jgi:hypothetical protein